MKRLFLVLSLIVALACSQRDRANPLDPLNPVTHGAPSGFRVAAHRHTAALSWDSVAVEGMRGYIVYRGGGPGPAALAPVDFVEDTQWMDTGLVYDVAYTYAVQAVTSSDTSTRTEVDTTIPGPRNFLIADYAAGAVHRISYDGAHALSRAAVSYPRAVAWLPGNETVWVADYYAQEIRILDRHLQYLDVIPLTGWPVDLEADTTRGRVFLLQERPELILIFNVDRTQLEIITVPVTLDADSRLSYDPVSRSLWLSIPATYFTDRVYRLRPPSSGARWDISVELARSYQLQADPRTGGCWAATDSGAVYIDSNGDTTRYLTNSRVWDLSLNAVSGDVYYVATGRRDGSWACGRIGHDPILGADYPFLYYIQALPGTEPTGFLVYQANTRRRLLRFDSLGRLIGRIEGFGEYLDFTLE